MPNSKKADNRPESSQDEISQWMETPEAEQILYRVARSVLRFSRSGKYSADLFDMDTTVDPTSEHPLDEIRSALVEFVLSSDRLKEILADGESNKPGALLRTAFTNHLKDRRARGPSGNPWRYLRKRALEILRESGRFRIVKRQKASLFGLDENAERVAMLFEDDFREIPFPVHLVDRLTYEEVNTRRAIPKLADWFLERVAAMWDNRPVLADVNDFVTWIMGCVSPDPCSFRRDNDPEVEPADVSSRDRVFDPEKVRRWAGAFGNRLEKQEALIFYLRVCRGKTLKEVAELAGYKSPASPGNRLESVTEEMKSFLREMPWLSPDDFDEEAWSLFFEFLCEKLEKNVATPS